MEYERLFTRLGELDTNARCPSCDGIHKWHGLGGDAPEPLVLASIQKDGSVRADVGFGVVGPACSNCGFVRLHALDVIDRPQPG